MALFPFSTKQLDTLTAVGVTTAVRLKTNQVTFQVTTTGIGTDAVLRFEGSLDNTYFFNLDSTETDTTISADGTTGYSVSDLPLQYVRVRLVSFTGGTPSVTTKVGGL